MEATNSNPPFFLAIEPHAWSVNRFYRVYIARDEVVGVWAGSGNDMAIVMAAGGGLVGGLVAAAMNPARKNSHRSEELDAKPLSESRDDHKHNFALRLDEIDEAEIIPPGFWFRVNYATIPAVALLRLRMRDGGRRVLAITSSDDLRRALDLLEPPLNSTLRIGVPSVAESRPPSPAMPARALDAAQAGRAVDQFEAAPGAGGQSSGSKTLVIWLAIMGLFLGIGGVALGWSLFFRNRMPDDNWQKLQSADGHFEIQFPEPPETVRERKSTPAGPVDTFSFKRVYNRPAIAFTASYFDATPAAIHAFPLEQRFQEAREGARAAIRGEIISDRAIQLGFSSGKEWHIKGQNLTSVIRMYAIPDGENTRVFVLRVEGDDVSPSTPAASKFLNSFNFNLPDPVEAVPIADAWWKPFYSMEAGFQISFPGQPERQERRIQFVVGEVNRVAYTKGFANPIVSFWADFMDLNRETAQQCPPDRCFNYLIARMLGQLRGGKVISEKALKLGNHPGKECVLAGMGSEVATRMYVVPAGDKTRLVLLMVRGVNIRPAAADVARFFDSFSYKQP